jgi:hypothetical protein
MSWRRPERALLGLWAGAAVLLLAAAVLGFGFYAPRRGQLAAGAAEQPEPAERRDRARVVVEAVMAPAEGERPSLADVARFYGLEPDSLPCSVRETLDMDEADLPDDRARQRAERPLRLGEEVTLCLD